MHTPIPAGPLLSGFCHFASLVSDFSLRSKRLRRRIYLCNHLTASLRSPPSLIGPYGVPLVALGTLATQSTTP